MKIDVNASEAIYWACLGLLGAKNLSDFLMRNKHIIGLTKIIDEQNKLINEQNRAMERILKYNDTEAG